MMSEISTLSEQICAGDAEIHSLRCEIARLEGVEEPADAAFVREKQRIAASREAEQRRPGAAHPDITRSDEL